MYLQTILTNPTKLTISYNFNHHKYNLIFLNSFNNSRKSVALFLSFSIASAITRNISTMITAASSTHSGGEFITLAEIVKCEKEIKKSKFIAIASPIFNEQYAQSFLSEVRDNRATHNCWAYKCSQFIFLNSSPIRGQKYPTAIIGDQYRSSDDGEPSGTAGKPIYSAIASSGIDRVMVVVIRYFGGIKLGTGGLVRAYGGVTLECLKNAPTRLVKSKVPMGVEVTFDLLGLLYHQLQFYEAADVKQDYETGKDDTAMVTFKVDFDKAGSLEDAIKGSCGRDISIFKH